MTMPSVNDRTIPHPRLARAGSVCGPDGKRAHFVDRGSLLSESKNMTWKNRRQREFF
jgi:hypothetical protein